MITFLKTHLIGCVREKNLEVFNDLVLYISNSHLHAQEWTLDKEDLKVIIHYKTNDVNSLFYKTALNWANENNDRVMTLELLKLEQKAHSSEKEGLACLRNNLSRDVMLPWIIESYRKFYQETVYTRWCRVFFTVVIELLLLSYVPFMYDIYSDIVLAVSYHRIAYSNKTFDESELSNCSGNQLNFSCYERTRMSIRELFPNSSFDTLIQSDGFQSYENSLNLHQMFEAAFIATCFSIIISLSFYIYSIPIDLQGLFLLPYNIRKIMPDKFNQGVTRMQWFMNDKSRRKNRVVLFLSKIFLMGLGKVLWPFIHILRRMQYLASLKGIVQPFELGGETRLIRSAVK